MARHTNPPTSASTSPPTPAGDSVYRPNVAGLFTNAAGELLVAERIDVPGAWQFPQGGVDDGEDLPTAFAREMHEELGLESSAYKVVRSRGGYRYDIPPTHPKRGRFTGQDQTYFLCTLTAPDTAIRLDAHTVEFARWKWIQPAEFDLAWTVEFKRDVFRRVLFDFFGVYPRSSG
jgi:putative (di)nucleoside polyphosphate hydrolase